MMKCPKCGTKNTEGNRYCERCGASLQKPSAHISVRWILRISFVVIILIVSLLLYRYITKVFNLNGNSPIYYNREKHTDPKELVADYVLTMQSDELLHGLSYYHPALSEYYSRSYRTNEDLLWLLDMAYSDDSYIRMDEYTIENVLEWDPRFYEGKLEQFGINAQKGYDLKLMFIITTAGRADSYYYQIEMVEEKNGDLYILSVYR